MAMTMNWTAAGVVVALITGLAGMVFAGLAHRANARSSVRQDGEWKGKVDADRRNFKEFMTEVRRDIRELRGDVKKIFDRLATPSSIITRRSPLRLTELGEAISKEIGGKALASRIATNLGSWATDKDAYAIQEYSFEYVEEFQYSDEERKTIRKSAYDNGLDVSVIRRVLAIELRDKLLKITDLEAP